MNQKQRDLLCKMLKDKCDSLENDLKKRFPIAPSRYSCRQQEFEDKVGTLPPGPRKQFEWFRKREIKLQDQQNTLTKEWDKLFVVIQDHCDKQQLVKKSAEKKLKTALDESVIQIQFADDANTAKAILKNLPTIEELVS